MLVVYLYLDFIEKKNAPFAFYLEFRVFWFRRSSFFVLNSSASRKFSSSHAPTKFSIT